MAAGAGMSAPHWNGNQVRVLNAVKQGVGNRKAIATWLGIDQMAVDNALRRLLDKKEIRAVAPGCYEPTSELCLLAEVWR